MASRESLALDTVCPTCLARKGRRCLDLKTKEPRQTPHRSRARRAQKESQ